MKTYLIKDACIINDSQRIVADVLIKNKRLCLYMLSLESRCIPVVRGGVLIPRTRPKQEAVVA